MLESSAIPFHFIRPIWLLALVPVAAVLALVIRRERAETRWGDMIAPHLLKHLIVRPRANRDIPAAYLVAIGLVLAIVALSGPTWRHELPPFVEDKAPLAIALAVTSSMTERDVAPSRLERAKQKVRDLLAARAGARTALVAYASTAHLVMPLTDDRAVTEPFLAALSPAVMPGDGKNVVAAVALSTRLLAAEPVAGTILLIADDLGTVDSAALRQAAGRNSVLMLSVASQGAQTPAVAAGAVRVSADSSDIRTLERRIETRFEAAQTDTFGARWRDEGYWLLLPAAFLCLLWFRRGTTIVWVLLVVVGFQPAPARADGSSWFRNLWLTPNQQGRVAFDRGDYASAAKLFADPLWRGIAAYRAYDFLTAAEAFRKIETVEGRFALGNAEAQNHAFEKAIKAYDEVLAEQPNHAAAKINRQIVLAALKRQEEKRQKSEQDQRPPDLPADDTKVDPNQKDGERVKIQPEDVTTAGAAEAWMRQVQTSPADFLKLKFAIQADRGSTSGESRR